MKKLFLLILIFASVLTFSQSQLKITSKKCIPKKGFYLKLKSILLDSRCPENVTCIWAGEVSVVLEVYKDKQLLEEKTILFNSLKREENIKWFENYYTKKIKTISVIPYPKEGIAVNFKKKYIRILFID